MSTQPTSPLFSMIVLLLAFIGGFTIMSVELLGGRILAPFFGSSIHVWGSIITVFMLSLSVGYLYGGKLSMKNPGLGRFGWFFLIAAVALLPVNFLGDHLMNSIFLYFDDPRYGSLLASAALFFIPTVILGMIAPYSVRLLVRQSEHSGRVAGSLYFVSTLGSAIGTLATSFYLVLFFEIREIIISLVVLLVTSGTLCIIYDKYYLRRYS